MDNRALEKKVEQLEDELVRKREAVAKFVFQYITDNFGVHPYRKQKVRDAVIQAFHEVYINWNKI